MKNVTIVDEMQLSACGESEMSEVLLDTDAGDERDDYNDDFDFEL